MANRIFVDTSFVLALINERDQYHKQAEALSFKFEESFLITTVAVLLEIGNALAKGFRREANAVLRLLRSSARVEVVQIDVRILEKALEIALKARNAKAWGSAPGSMSLISWSAEGAEYVAPSGLDSFLIDLIQGLCPRLLHFTPLA